MLPTDADCEVEDLDYFLPAELIAQHPARRREDARLLAVDRKGSLRDLTFSAFPGLLRRGDLLVLNNTKVLPAKFAAFRNTGGRVEGLFLAEQALGQWRLMLKSSGRLRLGEVLRISDVSRDVMLHLTEKLVDGEWQVAVAPAVPAEELLQRIGQTPLPPYIRRFPDDASRDAEDRRRYQTVYAREPGAIAAPTAGLHFTEPLLSSIRDRGVEVATLTLHVGAGTFRPITVSQLSRHHMHAEFVCVGRGLVEAIGACRERSGRVVAVGTTTVRALETAARRTNGQGGLGPFQGMTDLFIRRPFQFRVVDALLTNFHLPRSTLLALVMAFAGVERVRRAYQHAVEARYRFYSFGDAMFLY